MSSPRTPLGDGELLLVSCYELGHQPLGLAWPKAFLEREGWRPRAIDLTIEDVDDAQLARTRFLGISVPMHTAMRIGMDLARRARRIRPDVHICFYGLYAPLNRDVLVDEGLADSVVGGEHEALLVEAVRAAEQGRSLGTPPPELSRLAFPVPSRAGLAPLERYASLVTPEGDRAAGYVEASRGCLHECRHCPIPAAYGGRFFVVPPEVVLDDVGGQIAAGARHVTFGDPDFLNGPGHSMAVVRALHERHPEVTFDVTTKVEHVLKHADLFDELGGLGCAFVVSAVESLSDEVLGHLHKGHTRDDVKRALEIVQGAGIALRPSLVPFTPWTTLADYLELLEWIAQERLVDRVDPIQLAIRLLVPPGSLLLREPGMREHLGELEPESLTYRWSHPDPRMDRLQREVQELVARDASAGASPLETFRAIYEHAFAVAGRPSPAVPPAPEPQAPRLTEAWFCCAEPISTSACERS